MPTFDAVAREDGSTLVMPRSSDYPFVIPKGRAWTVDKDGTVTVCKPTKSVAAEMRERFKL